MKNLKRITLVLLAFAMMPVGLYLLLIGMSHAFVSGGLGHAVPTYWDESLPGQVYISAQQLGLPGLQNPGLLQVDRVDVSHLPRNAVYLLSSSALCTLIPVVLLIGGIAVACYGLFTGHWDQFLIGILAAAIMAPISILVLALLAGLTWLSLLLQPCTPMYAVAWTILGLPLIALGAAIAAAPTAGAVVVVYGPVSIFRG